MNNNIMISILKGIQKDYPLTNAEWQAIEQAKENAKSLPSVTPQEPKTDVLDKIRAEIDVARYVDKDTKLCKNANASGLEIAMQIIDKCRKEV